MPKAVVEADEALAPLNLTRQRDNYQQRIEDRKEEIMKAWQSKALRGRFYSELNQKYVDTEASCKWITGW